jgi:hypothetical protein
MGWVPVATTKPEKRLFAHNWTKRQAKRREAFIERLTGEAKIRFNIERLGFFDWRVLPDVWVEEEERTCTKDAYPLPPTTIAPAPHATHSMPDANLPTNLPKRRICRQVSLRSTTSDAVEAHPRRGPVRSSLLANRTAAQHSGAGGGRAASCAASVGDLHAAVKQVYGFGRWRHPPKRPARRWVARYGAVASPAARNTSATTATASRPTSHTGR